MSTSDPTGALNGAWSYRVTIFLFSFYCYTEEENKTEKKSRCIGGWLVRCGVARVSTTHALCISVGETRP